MHIQIVLYNGFDELDVIAPFEVLRSVIPLVENLRVELVTLDDMDEIVAHHGLRVLPEGRLSTDVATRPDVLLIPGGGWNDRSPQGARAEAERGDLPAAIARLHAQGTIIASVCTGGMLVAAAGLNNNRPAITHHSAVEDLRASGAKVINARVVDDGDLVSSGGVTSGLDLALWLVERFFGTEVAVKAEQRLEYERRGTVWRR